MPVFVSAQENATECISPSAQFQISDIFKIEIILDDKQIKPLIRGNNTFIRMIPETGRVCVIEGIQRAVDDNFVFEFQIKKISEIETRPEKNILKGNNFILEIYIKKQVQEEELVKEEIIKIIKAPGFCENLGEFVTENFVIQVIKNPYGSGKFVGNNFKIYIGTPECEKLLKTNKAPVINSISATSVSMGATSTITINFSDSDAHDPSDFKIEPLLIRGSSNVIRECLSPTISAINQTNGTYQATCEADTTGWEAGWYSISAKLHDSHGGLAESSFEDNANILYINMLPAWSANGTSISSPATYNTANNYGFQITSNDPDGNMNNTWFQLGRPSGVLTNYSALNNSASGKDVWYYNLTQAALGGAGTYNITWFLNDMLNAQNKTDTVNYVVNKGVLTLTIASNGTQTYPYTSTSEGWDNNIGDGDITYWLTRNGLLVDSASPWFETNTLGVGTYTYKFNTSSATDYTNWTANATGVTTTLTINKGTPTNMNIYINSLLSDATITYPSTVTIVANASALQGATDLTYTLYRLNTTSLGSGTSITNNEAYSNSTITFQYNTTGGTNYTQGNATIRTLKVNKGTLTLTISGGGTANYPNASHIIATEVNIGDTDITYWLTMNGELKDSTSPYSDQNNYSVGTYIFRFNTSANSYTNWTANATGITTTLTINQGTRTVSLTLDGQASDITTIYNGTSVLYPVVASESNTADTDCVYTLYENAISTGQTGSSITYNVNRGNNTFVFAYNSSACTNWSAVTQSRTLKINKGILNLTITNPQTVTYPTETTVTGTETNTGDTDVTYKLYRDNTLLTGSSETNTLGGGITTYKFNATSSTNWTQNDTGVTTTVTVNKANPSSNLNIYLDSVLENKTVNYPTIANATGNRTSFSGATDLTYNFYGNDILIGSGVEVSDYQRLGNGTYVYRFNTTGGTNYTQGNATLRALQVLKGTSDVKVYIDNTSTNKTVTYNPSLSIEIRGNSTTTITPPTFNLYFTKAGTFTSLGNPATITNIFGAGTYQIFYNTTGNTNWTAEENNTLYLIVNTNTTNMLNLYFNNGTQYLNQNITVTYPTQANATGLHSYSGNAPAINLYYNNQTTTWNNTLITLGAGQHEFNLNTSGNTNYSSNERRFWVTVNKGTLALTIASNGTQTYPFISTTEATETNSGDTDITYWLTRNDVLVDSTSPYVEIIGLSAGTYNYKFNTSATSYTNWTANSTGVSTTLTINRATSSLSISGTGTQAYPYTSTVTGSETNSIDTDCSYNLYKNDISVSNPEINEFSVGTYTYVFNNSQCTNFSAGTTTQTLTINKGTLSLTVTGGGTATYPNASHITATEANNGDADITYWLTRNGALSDSTSPYADQDTYGAGTYTFRFNTSASTYTNWTANSTGVSTTLTINRAASSLSISGTGIQTYPYTSTVTGSETNSIDTDCSYNLYRNAVLVSNPETKELSAGTYTYVFNNSQCTNFSAGTTSSVLTINQGTRTVALTLDGQNSDITRTYNGTSVLYPIVASESNSADTDCTYTLFENAISTGQTGSSITYNVNRGNNTFVFAYNSSACTNWSAVTQSRTLNVNKGTLSLLISGGGTATYPNASHIIATESNTGDTDITYWLSVNGLLKDSTSPYSNQETYGAGTHIFKFNTSGTSYQNWTANVSGASVLLTINQNTTNPINIEFYNTTDYYTNQNITAEKGTQTIANGTASGGTVTLFRNETSVTNPDNQNYLSIGTYKYKANTSGNANYSANATGATFYLKIQDTRPPQYSQNETNSTLAGNPALFSLYWTDINLAGYIFSFDNCIGTFTNDTWIEMIGTGNWSNTAKTLNSTVGCVIQWRVYANDTAGNMNASEAFSFRTTAGLCSSNSISCAIHAYPFSGWVFESGNLLDSGTLKLQIKETEDVFTSTFSGGYFSINPSFCLSPGRVYSFVLIAESSGKKSILNFKRTANSSSENNVSCSSSQPSCSFSAYPVSGWALDSKTGLPIQSGTAKVSIAETGDTYSTTFTNGYFSISPQFCLTNGKTYNFVLSVEGGGRQGFMTYRRAGKT